MKGLVIWGASGHALVVADIFRLTGEFEVVGFLDDVNLKLHGTQHFGLTVLGGREQLSRLLENGVQHLVVAIGDNKARLQLTELADSLGFTLVTAIHPRATVAADVQLGAGSVVAAGAVINPGTKLGSAVILNTSASVDHECVVEDGVHICPGARLGGRVRVGRGAWIGIGATVKDRITIGSYSFIGAGAVIIRDVRESVLVCGVPGREVRTLT